MYNPTVEEKMSKSILANLLLILCFCGIASSLSATTVKTMQKAAACPNPSDFEHFFELEAKLTGNVEASVPPNCKLIPDHTTLTLTAPTDGKIEEIQQRKYRFFHVQSPTDKNQSLWIPAFFVSEPAGH